jgi:uncharacterized metal-binding protein
MMRQRSRGDPPGLLFRKGEPDAMPTAKTHDLITLLLAPPTFLGVYATTGSRDIALLATGAMLFSGFMFGPDLDINSKQYARWGPFGFLWWPYRVIFRHRSRLSHGILLGTAIRVVYFVAVLVVTLGAGLWLIRLLRGPTFPDMSFQRVLSDLWQMVQGMDRRYLLATFVGLWWGAVSHTLTDWVWGLWTHTKRIF